jgi:hypothetical protein
MIDGVDIRIDDSRVNCSNLTRRMAVALQRKKSGKLNAATEFDRRAHDMVVSAAPAARLVPTLDAATAKLKAAVEAAGGWAFGRPGIPDLKGAHLDLSTCGKKLR